MSRRSGDPSRTSLLLPFIFSTFVVVFSLLSLWNSHKAISATQILWSNSQTSSKWFEQQGPHEHQASRSTISPPRSLQVVPETVCLTDTCMVRVANSIARGFPERPQKSWCVPAHARGENSYSYRDNLWQGLLLVKVPKAASSTSAGLALRIANRTKCAVQWEHREGIHYANRSRTSFLFGSVRRPASRNLSSVWFFMIAPMGIEPTDNNIIRSLHTHRGGKTKGKGGFQFVYLSLEPVEPRSVWTPYHPTRVIHPQGVHAKIQRLLRSYDFMIVVERMDESLTALALLTGLSLPDVLVTSSKVAGGYLLVRVGKDAGQCRRQLKGPLSEGVKNYTESDEWLAMNYADEILFRAANASLDRTIDQLGRERFETSLREFRQLKERVLRVCGANLGFGCTDQGTPLQEEECYLRDFGCGYSCVDSVVDHPG